MIDSRDLIMMAIIDLFGKNVNANVFSEELTQLDNLHMI